MSLDDGERAALREKFVEYARTRDHALRDELITAHIALAEYLARRFSNRGEPLDDLVQVASLALLKAVERFDPDRGLEFSTFATPTIVGELKRHFRDKGWAVRVPRRVQELHLQLSSVVASLAQELGRSPTIPEIAKEAGATEEEVLEAMEAGRAYRLTSIDAPRAGDNEEEGTGIAARLGDEDARLESVEVRLELSPLLESLPPREQLIVHLRFFEGLTQSEIASRLNISQVHVSRLLARSLQQLRERGELGGASFASE
jgi:RNA polymerase sigma-B factor